MASKIKVILLQNFAGLGNKGQVVEVSVPYARNVLISKGIAQIADSQILNTKKQQDDKKQKDLEKSMEGIQKLVETLKENGGMVITTKSTNTGKLYAKIDEKELIKEILMKYKIKLSKENISLSHKIEEIGSYEFEISWLKNKEKIALTIKN